MEPSSSALISDLVDLENQALEYCQAGTWRALFGLNLLDFKAIQVCAFRILEQSYDMEVLTACKTSQGTPNKLCIINSLAIYTA